VRKAIVALMFAAVQAQAADQLGTIVFPNSGKPEAQEAFLRGVLLLHNFAYPQAAKAFVEAETIDPNFGLAYWGEAMTYNHPIWYESDENAGRKALAKFNGTVTPRERAYLDAVAALYNDGNAKYEAAMERLAKTYSDDVEAQVFWALSVLGNQKKEDVDPRRRIRAAAILEPLLPSHLDHPGVLHYMIHAYDDPVHAPLGLRAARRYAVVASGAPHALHMPSHIFLQLGMWQDAARSNEAAWMLSNEWAARDYHSLEWLQYVYLQQKRFDDAKRLLNEVAPKPDEGMREHHARDNMQARYAIETGDFSVLDKLDPHPAVQFALGMRAALAKEYSVAQTAIGMLKASNGDMHNMNRNVAEVQRNELLAVLYAARGERSEALRVAQLAIDAEEKLGVPSGPPDAIKPARELYADLLLAAGRKEQAAEQYRELLLNMPNRAASVAGLAKATQ
jgi:tetratricopeptide (TPR) repeat protein